MEKRFETFTSLILQINRTIQRLKNIEATEFQLKGTQGLCLFYLHRTPRTQGELAKLCLEDKAAVSRAVAELVKRGLVLDAQNGRGKKYKAFLGLTPEGEALAERVEGKITNAVEAVGQGLGEAERIVLYKSLRQINENLERFAAHRQEPDQTGEKGGGKDAEAAASGG